MDYVLSHTAPLKYEPRELFLDFIDQSKVDKFTEEWLSEIEEKLDYAKWFFGHYHGNKRLGKSEMLFEGIKELGALHFYRRWVFLYIKKVILCRSKYVKMADKTY